MSSESLLKTGLIGLMLVLAAIGPGDRTFAIGLPLFGVFNLLVTAPGTRWVRIVSIAVTLIALASPRDVQRLIAVVGWLAWPPCFLIGWGLGRDYDIPGADPGARRDDGYRARLWAAAAIIGAVAIASLVYRFIVEGGYGQTAALFVGVPALLAIAVLFAPPPRSAIGVACKAVTVGLLVSLIFLGEGLLCVLMSAPLFYVVAVVVGLIIEGLRQRRQPTTLLGLAVLAVVPLSLEGVTVFTTLDRESVATETRVVQATPEAVARALMAPPRFERVMPAYLRAGFPWPVATRIDRDAAGARWVIRMRGGEMRLDGMEPRAGDLILQLEEARPGFVRWRAIADDSHMTHFLRWRESTVEWEAAGDGATRVTWTVRYSRDLDPSWYFGWWEHYAASLAAGYLIESVATP